MSQEVNQIYMKCFNIAINKTVDDLRASDIIPKLSGTTLSALIISP